MSSRHEIISALHQETPTGALFEDLMEQRCLLEVAPLCYLRNISLFRPDRLNLEFNSGYDANGYELDFLLHWHAPEGDRLVIVETKAAPVQGSPSAQSPWFFGAASPTSKPRDGKEQLLNEATALWANLFAHPSPRLRIEAFLVTADALPAEKQGLTDDSRKADGLVLRLTSLAAMHATLQSPSLLNKVFGTSEGRFLRVSESPLLRKLRDQVPHPELGHPEPANGIRFIDACRQNLDAALFSEFLLPEDRQNTGKSRWAINGTAGMGKSVLLAYAACVLATNRQLTKTADFAQKPGLEPFPDRADLPTWDKRRILLCGMNHKQRDLLRPLWNRFDRYFTELQEKRIEAHLPDFKIWCPTLPLDDYNIILLDEAHDLDDAGQKRLADWHAAGSPQKPRYLIIACDRHQKLRYLTAAADARIINGMSFSGAFTRRLKRNYRNPAPIYLASLSLLFRWFGEASTKVIPTQDDLANGFHLTVGISPQVTSVDRLTPDHRLDISLRSDAHPANHWLSTVAAYPSASSLFDWLDRQPLSRQDVLWIRFAPQHPDFDYEQLDHRFGLLNLHAHDVAAQIDGYVKGREFPIVVIEDVPADFAPPDIDSPDAVRRDEVRRKMWTARRQLYLCASRAKAFLYFVDSADPVARREIRSLCDDLTFPHRQDPHSKEWSVAAPGESGTRTWHLALRGPAEGERATLDAFEDTLAKVPLANLAESFAAPEPVFRAFLHHLGVTDELLDQTTLSAIRPRIILAKQTLLPAQTLLPELTALVAQSHLRDAGLPAADSYPELTRPYLAAAQRATPRFDPSAVLKEIGEALNIRPEMARPYLAEIELAADEILSGEEKTQLENVCLAAADAAHPEATTLPALCDEFSQLPKIVRPYIQQILPDAKDDTPIAPIYAAWIRSQLKVAQPAPTPATRPVTPPPRVFPVSSPLVARPVTPPPATRPAAPLLVAPAPSLRVPSGDLMVRDAMGKSIPLSVLQADLPKPETTTVTALATRFNLDPLELLRLVRRAEHGDLWKLDDQLGVGRSKALINAYDATTSHSIPFRLHLLREVKLHELLPRRGRTSRNSLALTFLTADADEPPFRLTEVAELLGTSAKEVVPAITAVKIGTYRESDLVGAETAFRWYRALQTQKMSRASAPLSAQLEAALREVKSSASSIAPGVTAQA